MTRHRNAIRMAFALWAALFGLVLLPVGAPATEPSSDMHLSVLSAKPIPSLSSQTIGLGQSPQILASRLAAVEAEV